MFINYCEILKNEQTVLLNLHRKRPSIESPKVHEAEENKYWSSKVSRGSEGHEFVENSRKLEYYTFLLIG